MGPWNRRIIKAKRTHKHGSLMSISTEILSSPQDKKVNVSISKLIRVQCVIRAYLIRNRRKRLLNAILKDVAALTIQRCWRKSVQRKYQPDETIKKIKLNDALIAGGLCHNLAKKILEDVSATYIQQWWRKLSQNKSCLSQSIYHSDGNAVAINQRHALLPNEEVNSLNKHKKLETELSNKCVLLSGRDEQALSTTKKLASKNLIASNYIFERAKAIEKRWIATRQNNTSNANSLRRQLIGHFVCRIFVLSLLWDVAAQTVQRWWRNMRRMWIFKGNKNKFQTGLIHLDTYATVLCKEFNSSRIYDSIDVKTENVKQNYQQFNNSKFLGLDKLHRDYVNGLEITENDKPQFVVWKSATWRNIHVHYNDLLKPKNLPILNFQLCIKEHQEDVACAVIQSWWKMIMQKRAYCEIRRNNSLVQRVIRSYLNKPSVNPLHRLEANKITEVLSYRSKSLGDCRSTVRETKAMKFRKRNRSHKIPSKTETIPLKEKTKKTNSGECRNTEVNNRVIGIYDEPPTTKEMSQLPFEPLMQKRIEKDLYLIKVQAVIRDFLQMICKQNAGRMIKRVSTLAVRDW